MARRTVMIATAILAISLAVRIIQVQSTSYVAPFDAGSYMSLASQIAHHGVYDPHGHGAGGTLGPTAYFPPAFPYLLAISDLVSGHTTKKGKAVEPARIEQAVLGTIIVALIGLVAFELFGVATALIAMALAAGYPVLVELSAILVAESLLTAFMLGAIYAVLRARRAAADPSRHGWIAGAGVLTGLAGLAHENGVLLVIPLALGALTAAGRPWRSLAAPAILLATAALTIAPWTIRNALDLHAFVPISDETGITLIGTYNAASAAYRPVPYKWRFFAGIPGESKRLGNTHRFTESELSSRLTSQALSYIAHHPAAPIAAAFHNTIRMLELEGTFAWKASAKAQGVTASVAHAGVIAFYVLAVLALLGTITAKARRTPRWIWAAGVLMWLSAVLVNMETPRFREPVEPFLVLLAACALATAAARAKDQLRSRAPVPAQRGPAVVRGAGEPVEVVERLP